MRRCALLGLTAALAACPGPTPEAPSDAGVLAEPALDAAAPVEIAGARTATLAETSTAGLQVERGVDRRLDREERVCGARPGWLEEKRCRMGPHVYATAALGGVKDLALGRAAAAARAREALLSGMKLQGVVQGIEVLDLWVCRDQVRALARFAPDPEVDLGVMVPPCGPETVTHPAGPPPGCPPWSTHASWRERSQLSVVGVAKAKNRALSVATATNRARAEATRVLAGVEVSRGGRGLVERAGGAPGYTEVSRNQATCRGYDFVLLVVEPVH